MTSAQTLTRAVAIEEVLADPPPEDRRWEIVRGQLVIEMPSGERHGEIVLRLAMFIGQHVRAHRLGRATAGDPGFVLERDPDTLRGPDVAFVASDRAGQASRGFRQGPPDLAVEVVSPNDQPGRVRDKASHWLEAGTRLVWVVWPDSQSVTEYRPGRQPRQLHADDSLDGAEVLPGFHERIGAIFE